jgi:hypothetical protein
MHRNLTAAAVLAAAGLAAGCGSSTSTATTRSGTQALAGSVSGHTALANQATIPLRLTGVVNTTGSIHIINSKSQNPITIKTGKGDLTVSHTKGRQTQRLLSAKTCRFAFGVHGTYTVVGSKSTGTFKNASGSGQVTLVFTASLPKKNGSCDLSSSAIPQAAGARVSFAAHGPITVK